MILGVGIDVVRIDRIAHWWENLGLVARYFHPLEIESIRRKGGGIAGSLAARFAAKEAFAKALGTGLRGFSLNEVQVENDPHGRPYLVLHGRARELFARRGGSRAHLSLTHEKDAAIAVVVIEGEV